MKLTLYKVTDSDNTINKVLTNPYEITINFKNDVDVVNLDIPLSNHTGIDYDDFNYAYIDVLGRYYFIDKVGKVSAKLTRLYLSCDVLETYKAEILASNARLTRGIKTGDYLNTTIENSIVASVSIHKSTVTIDDSKKSIILTTVGVL